jgi:hypothetical protein
MNLSDEQIEIALSRYIKDKEYKNKYYKNKYANDPVHRQKVKDRSKNYYHKNKKVIKAKIELQGDYVRMRKAYNYYKKLDRIEVFISKYPDEYKKYFENNDENII